MLVLTFSVTRLVFGSSDEFQARLFPPVAFDAKTNRLEPAGEPQQLPEYKEESSRQPDFSGNLPFLGGTVTDRLEHDGGIYLCGSHGLLISDWDVTDTPFPALGFTWIETLAARQLLQADVGFGGFETPEDLKVSLGVENPYYRAGAIASLLQPDRQRTLGPGVWR
jgi:hypothetical protein